MTAQAALPTVAMMAQAMLAAMPTGTAAVAVAVTAAGGRTSLRAAAVRTTSRLGAAVVAMTAGGRDATDEPAHEERDGECRSGPFQDSMHGISVPHHQ
jgi:hypothetical protein